ncbi:hypothetical protein BGX20_005073, partial [Mortierella sp. AD010]
MLSLKKLSIIFLQNPTSNSLIVIVFFACLAIYIGSVCEKLINDNDNNTDLMKLILVTVNIFGFILISLRRHINLYKVFRLKIILVITYIALLTGLIIDYHIMAIRFKNPEDNTPYNFNVDFLTLALTLLSDSMFLMVYIFFASRVMLKLTMTLIALELVVFCLSLILGSDDVIDIVNLSTSMVTLMFSIVFWSGETILDHPTNRFLHPYEEEVDMQSLLHR